MKRLKDLNAHTSFAIRSAFSPAVQQIVEMCMSRDIRVGDILEDFLYSVFDRLQNVGVDIDEDVDSASDDNLRSRLGDEMFERRRSQVQCAEDCWMAVCRYLDSVD